MRGVGKHVVWLDCVNDESLDRRGVGIVLGACIDEYLAGSIEERSAMIPPVLGHLDDGLDTGPGGKVLVRGALNSRHHTLHEPKNGETC